MVSSPCVTMASAACLGIQLSGVALGYSIEVLVCFQKTRVCVLALCSLLQRLADVHPFGPCHSQGLACSQLQATAWLPSGCAGIWEGESIHAWEVCMLLLCISKQILKRQPLPPLSGF